MDNGWRTRSDHRTGLRSPGFALALSLFAVLTVHDGALAQNVAELTARCGGNNPDISLEAEITACSNLLRVGGLTSASRNDALYNRGLAYKIQGDLDRAIADYTEAVRLNPRDFDSLNNRANAYIATDRFDLAIADFTTILQLQPQYGAAYRNRALARAIKGDLAGARSDLQQSIRLEAPNGPGKSMLDSLDAGTLLPRRGIEDLTSAMRAAPGDGSLLLERGMIRQNRGDYRRALEDFNSAIRLDPGLAMAYFQRPASTGFRASFPRQWMTAARPFALIVRW